MLAWRLITQVGALHRAKLDAELGLALISTIDGALHVIDLDDFHDLHVGETITLAERPPAYTLAAFNPGRTHLALSDGVHVSVIDLERRESSSWALVEHEAPLIDLAWRQDGEVLFSAHTRAWPERAWEPQTGERLPDAEKVLANIDRFGVGGLDPSWRWVTNGR